MKRVIILGLTVLFAGFLFSSCAKEEEKLDAITGDVLEDKFVEDIIEKKEEKIEDKIEVEEKEKLEEKEEKDINLEVLPTKWFPATFVISLEFAKEQAKFEADCPDYDNDGKGDNELSGVAGFINPEIKEGIEKGELVILYEFLNVTDFENTPSFELNGLLGKKIEEKPGEFLVQPESYGEDGQPLIAFKNAKIEAKKLSAGPSTFVLPLPLPDIKLDFELQEAYLEGTISKGGVDGVVVENGVMAGVLTKEGIENAISAAEKLCEETDPKPSACQYLPLIKSFLPTLDKNKDGKISLCTYWASEKAKIVGLDLD